MSAEPVPAPDRRVAGLPRSVAQRALLFGALAAGCGLRVYGFADHGLWIDEYGTWWAIAGGGFVDCWTRVLEIQGQSPLYYLIVLGSTKLFGTSPAALRLPSLVFGIGLLVLSYPIAARVFRRRRIAVLTVCALALDERLIYYAQEARPYSLALCLAACSFGFFATLLERDDRRAASGYCIATALTYYAHYFFGIIIAVQAGYAAWRALRRRRIGARVQTWILTGAGLMLLLAPGAWQLRALFARRASLDWIAAPSSWLGSFEPAVEMLDPTLFGVCAAAALLASWFRGRSDWRDALGAYGGIGVLWFVVPVLGFSVIPRLFGIHLTHARYLVVAAPAVPMLYAVVLALPGPRAALRALPLVAFVVASLALRIVPFVSEQGPFWWFYQHGWQAAAREVAEGFEAGDVVLYRTHFVELDQVVRHEASPATIEFVEWPLLAHWSTRFERRALPYTDDEQTREQIASILAEAASAKRIWIVGLDVDDPQRRLSVLARATRLAVQRHGMRVVAHSQYGLVHVARLEHANEP